jgi:L-lactate dehydrogenase
VAGSLARIIRAIRHDESPDSYGRKPFEERAGEVSLSLPRILGAGGVEARLEPSLTADEEAALIPKFCGKRQRRLSMLHRSDEKVLHNR